MDGFKEWRGGDEAPSDWDGGTVKLRDGTTYNSKYCSWWHGGSTAHRDIIAYRPTPPKFNVGDRIVHDGETGKITGVVDTKRVTILYDNGMSQMCLTANVTPAPWPPDEQTVQHCAEWLVLRNHPTLAADLKQAMGPVDPVEELARELYAVIYSDYAYDRDADKAYWSKLARHVMERDK